MVVIQSSAASITKADRDNCQVWAPKTKKTKTADQLEARDLQGELVRVLTHLLFRRQKEDVLKREECGCARTIELCGE